MPKVSLSFYSITLSIAASLFAVEPVRAQNAPFTFNVAVDVQDMHEAVNLVHVRCAVYGEAQGVPIGQGENTQKLSKNAFNGQVTVAVNMTGSNRPDAAQRYACRLRLVIEGNTAAARPAPNSQNIALRPAAGTAFVPLLEGSLRN